MNNQSVSQALLDIYHRLMARYGPQYWWPAPEPFEIIVGAILTQSAAWRNVEKAIVNLKAAKALSPEALRRLSLSEVATLIHPCGYYNAKALKLKSLASWLGRCYDDNLNKLFICNTEHLRQQLLSIHGIGQETADSIILYAAHKPVFVIDAYTRRISQLVYILALYPRLRPLPNVHHPPTYYFLKFLAILKINQTPNNTKSNTANHCTKTHGISFNSISITYTITKPNHLVNKKGREVSPFTSLPGNNPSSLKLTRWTKEPLSAHTPVLQLLPHHSY